MSFFFSIFVSFPQCSSFPIGSSDLDCLGPKDKQRGHHIAHRYTVGVQAAWKHDTSSSPPPRIVFKQQTHSRHALDSTRVQEFLKVGVASSQLSRGEGANSQLMGWIYGANHVVQRSCRSCLHSDTLYFQKCLLAWQTISSYGVETSLAFTCRVHYQAHWSQRNNPGSRQIQPKLGVAVSSGPGPWFPVFTTVNMDRTLFIAYREDSYTTTKAAKLASLPLPSSPFPIHF